MTVAAIVRLLRELGERRRELGRRELAKLRARRKKRPETPEAQAASFLMESKR